MTTVDDEDDDDFGSGGLATVIGVGLAAVVGAALISRATPRAAFEKRLRQHLAAHKVLLASAELGRGPQALTWTLTLKLPEGFMSVQAPLRPPQTDAFAPGLADEIAERVLVYLDGLPAHVV